jgi:diadenosine tetraphosphate (Ap4A) HIT family hydrolase
MSVRAGVYSLCDGYPVTEGHTLFIPSQHVGTASDLPPGILAALVEAAAEEGARLREEGLCEDFNLGLNDGPLAGQTIPHLHVHLIPRRKGDSPDPRGGVRWIIPAKADYWSERS